MQRLKYTFWQDGDFYLGFLNEYPEYWTQGTSREDLLENLRGLLTDLESETFLLSRRGIRLTHTLKQTKDEYYEVTH